MPRCSEGGDGRTNDLDEVPRTPKDVSATAPFLVPERAGVGEPTEARLCLQARTRPQQGRLMQRRGLLRRQLAAQVRCTHQACP